MYWYIFAGAFVAVLVGKAMGRLYDNAEKAYREGAAVGYYQKGMQ